jgi:hypothetical protein
MNHLSPSFLEESSHEILGNVARKSWQHLRLHLFGGWPLHAGIAKSAKFGLRNGGFASRRGFEKTAHHGYERACGDTGIQLTEELAAAIGHGHAASQPAEELDEFNRVCVLARQRRGFDAEVLQKLVYLTLKGGGFIVHSPLKGSR